MRTVEIVMAAVLASGGSGCGRAALIGNDTVMSPLGECRVENSCGGSGTADTAVSIAVVSATVGILGVALYQRLFGF
jgi:hypothetical protein